MISMLARFFKTFLRRYTCSVCHQYQATHGLMCVTCHLNIQLSRGKTIDRERPYDPFVLRKTVFIAPAWACLSSRRLLSHNIAAG